MTEKKGAMKDIFETQGFKGIALQNIIERYSQYLMKILMQKWDPWMKARHKKWKD